MAHESHSKAHATPREFKFVDQTDRSREGATAYQTVVRSHVMTEVRRQRRSKAKINAETGRHRTTRLISSGPDKTTAKDPPPSTSDDIHEASSSLTEPLAPTLTSSGGILGFQDFFHFQAERAVNSYSSDAALTIPEQPILVIDQARAGTVHSDTLADDEVIQNDVPIYSRYDQIGGTIPTPTILGISRIDPFRALPVPPDQDTYQLLDHYTFTIPFLMYGTRSRSPVHHQLYNCATQDPAAFHAVLAYSALQLDSMTDVQLSKRALRHSSRTLRLIHERIIEPLFKCDDGLVMAIAFLAFTERRFGDVAIAQRHWLALGELFRARGGIEGLRINHWLAATLYWNCLVWSSTFDPRIMATTDWFSLGTSTDAVTWPSDEFTGFLANLANLKSRLRSHIKAGCTFPCQYSCSHRRSVFTPSGPLYKLIAPTSLDKYCYGDRYSATNVQRMANQCKLPCILYLNIVMTEYDLSPKLMEDYLGKLKTCLFEDGLDVDNSAEHLLIKLLIGFEYSRAETTHRAHQTIRMVSVIEKLQVGLQHRIHTVLLGALVLHEIDAEPGLRLCGGRQGI
ncbi:hypothetical protein N431DRAFT_556330 [Stipitochalara longipes BDJ]|nr:hypothetical protein N431DRAFT_556330 [Stipitochalara longipes BDJ]